METTDTPTPWWKFFGGRKKRVGEFCVVTWGKIEKRCDKNKQEQNGMRWIGYKCNSTHTCTQRIANLVPAPSVILVDLYVYYFSRHTYWQESKADIAEVDREILGRVLEGRPCLLTQTLVEELLRVFLWKKCTKSHTEFNNHCISIHNCVCL